MTNDSFLIWVDLEMTGLDPETCAIIEMAVIITDKNLTELTAPLVQTIWQPESTLETMVPFVRKMHTDNGLLEQVRCSQISIDDAEREAMVYLTRYVPYRCGHLAGNSVWQDRRFLNKYMPTLVGYLHYRQVDVSSLKQLADWWYGVRYPKADEGKHTALFDIRQSIAELKYYQERLKMVP